MSSGREPCNSHEESLNDIDFTKNDGFTCRVHDVNSLVELMGPKMKLKIRNRINNLFAQ